MTQLTRRLRRLGVFFLRAALALGVVGVLLIAGILVYLRITNAQSDLSENEWQRLRARFLERAIGAAVPADVEAAPNTETPSPEPETTEPPARIPAPGEPDPLMLGRQRQDYADTRRKNVLELQPFRRTMEASPAPDGSPVQNATLVNINPAINAWYLLTLEWRDGHSSHHHLVNAHPKRQDIILDPDRPNGLTFLDTAGARYCELWSTEGGSLLTATATTPYVSICDEQITLRLPVTGRRTTLEWATDFLRDNVWNGEKITVLVRQSFFQDAYLETAEITDVAGASPEVDKGLGEAPAPARLDARFEESGIGVGDLGLELRVPRRDSVMAGKWHLTTSHPGIFVSVVRPNLLEPDIFTHHRDVVSRLDEIEQEALVYLVAFDLARFGLGFAVGTEHPRVDWSERVVESMRNNALPGPDGIADIDPLIRTGIVPRSLAERAVATFTGGFKRSHGAFRVSELAGRNGGTHYGFIESGTVLSKLQPGLATLSVLDDGTVDMKTWTEADDELLPRIAFARQNGLPIIEPDPERGEPVPGRQVSQWAAGNWSGSQDMKFRTVRAGAAIQDIGSKRFLIYAYFSAATPSAMARVFEAYGCRYAMLLDMNALEHTYMAMYRVLDGNLDVQHLVQGMEVLDKTANNQILPRFLGFADNRDFFYVLRKGDESENRDASP